MTSMDSTRLVFPIDFSEQDCERAIGEYEELRRRLKEFGDRDQIPLTYNKWDGEFDFLVSTDAPLIYVSRVRYNTAMTKETPNDAVDVRTFAGYQAACAAWLKKAERGECTITDAQIAAGMLRRLRDSAKEDGAADSSELPPQTKQLVEKLSAEVDELRRLVAEVATTARQADEHLVRGGLQTIAVVEKIAVEHYQTQLRVSALEDAYNVTRQRLQAWSQGVDVKLEAAGVALRQCGEAGLDLTRLVEGRTQALRNRAQNAEHRLRDAEEALAQDKDDIVQLEKKLAKLLPQDHPYDYDGNGCRKCGGLTSAIHPKHHTMECAGLGSNYEEKRFVPCDCAGVMPVQHPTPGPATEPAGE